MSLEGTNPPRKDGTNECWCPFTTHILTTRRLEWVWASTTPTMCLYPYLPSPNTHTHTHGPPLPPINSNITPPSGGPVHGDTHRLTHTHTHTHSRRGVGPAPLFLCALVTKEFWLPLPLILIISRSLTLSHSLSTLLFFFPQRGSEYSWKLNMLYWNEEALSCRFAVKSESHCIQSLPSSFLYFLLSYAFVKADQRVPGFASTTDSSGEYLRI